MECKGICNLHLSWGLHSTVPYKQKFKCLVKTFVALYIGEMTQRLNGVSDVRTRNKKKLKRK